MSPTGYPDYPTSLSRGPWLPLLKPPIAVFFMRMRNELLADELYGYTWQRGPKAFF